MLSITFAVLFFIVITGVQLTLIDFDFFSVSGLVYHYCCENDLFSLSSTQN